MEDSMISLSKYRLETAVDVFDSSKPKNKLKRRKR